MTGLEIISIIIIALMIVIAHVQNDRIDSMKYLLKIEIDEHYKTRKSLEAKTIELHNLRNENGTGNQSGSGKDQ